jgi:hypothetical protein
MAKIFRIAARFETHLSPCPHLRFINADISSLAAWRIEQDCAP